MEKLAETICGFINSITFYDDSSGYTVAKIKVPNHKEPITITGSLPGVKVGETIQCEGKWKKHLKFGNQFEVSDYKTQAPSDEKGIRKYLDLKEKSIRIVLMMIE